MPLRGRTRRARRLRRQATDIEKLLWRALREQLPEFRIRRQHPIGRHIVDFACPSRKLAIELDGSQHLIREREDFARTTELGRHGYRVIRFWNSDVMANLLGVVQSIRRELDERPQ